MNSPRGGTAEVVATVAGHRITVRDLDDREAAVRHGPVADRLPERGTPESLRLRRWLVQLLVTERVVLHEAAAAGFPGPGGPPASELGELAVRALGPVANGARPADAYLTSDAARRLFERVTEDVTVPEADVRAYFDRNADRYRREATRRVRHVLVADASTARVVADRIAAGEDMGELARLWSLDRGTRQRGGDLGEVARGEFVGPFEDAVFAARAGAVVGPFATEFGWHVARVEGATPARRVPYEAARASIAADLLAAARGRAFDRWLDERRAALAEIAPFWVHPANPSLPDAVHRH